MSMRVLLIEDEPKIASFVTSGLGERGFDVTHCDNGLEGYEFAQRPCFDVIVLDLMLPGKDGHAILKELRAKGNNTPVILLTALNELNDRVEGLNHGADDYLSKPFYVEELAARIQALIRRLPGERQSLIQQGPLRLDRINRTVHVKDAAVELASREFALLEYMMRSPGQVFARAQILEHVWGYDFDPSTNVVDVCVNRLRSKLSSVEIESEDSTKSDAGSFIESVRGVGYRFRKTD